eukprot:c24068_g1_i2 orf=415-1710(+)
MWKSHRIATAHDCCRKKQREREVKQAPEQEETTPEREDEAPGYGSAYPAEIATEAEEKLKLFICTEASGAHGRCRGKNYGISSSLCNLPSRAAMASKVTSTLRDFLSFHLKKLPATSHLRSRCDAVKRKCTISFTGPVLCFPCASQFKEGESTIDQEMRDCLVDLGIHVPTPVLHCHRRFSLHELHVATSQFAEKNMLGKGSSGCVYRGVLPSTGLSVAVKVLNVRLKDARLSFVTELEIMCHVQDRYILPLLGYCVEEGHLLLVYTYMPQGSLEAWLHNNCSQGKAGVRTRGKLSWSDRRKIAIGITRALHYLHTECKPPIIHRDVKSSNILLTKRNDPKLSDFGLAIKASLSNSICKDVMGTFGYLAPEYFQSGKVSTKIDIYSLGIVLLELMTGRRPIDNDMPLGEGNLANWVKNLIFLESKHLRELY